MTVQPRGLIVVALEGSDESRQADVNESRCAAGLSSSTDAKVPEPRFGVTITPIIITPIFPTQNGPAESYQRGTRAGVVELVARSRGMWVEVREEGEGQVAE